MKQTVEEAAYDYATNKTKFRKDVLKEVDADTYVSRHADSMDDFQCGAECHQSATTLRPYYWKTWKDYVDVFYETAN